MPTSEQTQTLTHATAHCAHCIVFVFTRCTKAISSFNLEPTLEWLDTTYKTLPDEQRPVRLRLCLRSCLCSCSCSIHVRARGVFATNSTIGCASCGTNKATPTVMSPVAILWLFLFYLCWCFVHVHLQIEFVQEPGDLVLLPQFPGKFFGRCLQLQTC